jgi:lipopolysaccharide export system permease protein
MIYRSALWRELTTSSSASLIILAAITLVTLFIRLLGDVARGELANEAIFLFLGFTMLQILPVLLSISLFIGVFTALSRFWRDSEMVIWLSGGLSLTGWIRPVLMFAAPLVLIMLLLTLVLVPWSQNEKNVYKQDLSSRNEMAALGAGVFAEAAKGTQVYFAETINPLTGTIRKVFMQTEEDGEIGLVVANSGRYEQREDGSRYLVLEQGRRYLGQPGEAKYQMVKFDRYSFRLDPVPLDLTSKRARELRLGELLHDPNAANMGELHWRLSIPFSAVVLVLLAIPLSYVNNRAKRAWGMLIALLLYFVYNNLMSIGQTYVGQGRMGIVEGLLLSHLPMIFTMLVLFALRTGWRPRWRPA